VILLPIKEEFDQMLLTVSSVVTQLEEHRYSFIDEVRDFISKAVTAAEKYHLTFAPEMEIIKGKLYVIDEMGEFQRQGAGYSPDTRRSYRRNREAFALRRLDEACQLIRGYFAASEAAFSECETVCRQIASVAQTKGLIPGFESGNREAQLRALLEKLTQDRDLYSPCTQITGMVGIHNAVILFDRALDEVSR
jgi:hypothetical protein